MKLLRDIQQDEMIDGTTEKEEDMDMWFGTGFGGIRGYFMKRRGVGGGNAQNDILYDDDEDEEDGAVQSRGRARSKSKSKLQSRSKSKSRIKDGVLFGSDWRGVVVITIEFTIMMVCCCSKQYHIMKTFGYLEKENITLTKHAKLLSKNLEFEFRVSFQCGLIKK